jgi:elongation factor G
MHADKRTEIDTVAAGDIVAITGLKEIVTGETLCIEQRQIVYDLMEFPETVISVAIEPKTTADEKKLMESLKQLQIEDPSFTYNHNAETGQLLIKGMGELHLEIIADRLEREFKVGIRVGSPQVSFRESIKSEITKEKTFEKEQGGKVQFGKVTLKVEPTDFQAGVEFKSDLTKRDLPQNYIDAIEKSIADTAPGGALAGYAFLNIKTTLVAAEYREEDSSEVAYVIAASQAFSEACREAGLELLEPVMDLEIISPAEYTGDIISDINAKKGQILGMNAKGQKEVITAEVPLREMFGYSTDLRSKSQGRANFTMSFKNYRSLSHAEAKEILEKKGIFI